MRWRLGSGGYTNVAWSVAWNHQHDGACVQCKSVKIAAKSLGQNECGRDVHVFIDRDYALAVRRVGIAATTGTRKHGVVFYTLYTLWECPR